MGKYMSVNTCKEQKTLVLLVYNICKGKTISVKMCEDKDKFLNTCAEPIHKCANV